MLEKDHPFEKISDALGIEYSPEPSKELEKESSREIMKVPFQEMSKKDSEEFPNVAYMEFELKGLIEGGMEVLQKLKEDIKIGTSPRSHEVYLAGLGNVKEVIKELKDLYVDISKTKEKAPQAVVNNTQNNIYLDSKSISELIKKANKESELTTIKAEFEIDESEFKNF